MSTERDETTDQPEPKVNERAFVQDLVVNDIEDRKQFGINKYGTALQSGNGRDMLQDAYEEVLDLAIYLRGMKDEDHHLLLELQRARKERNALIETCVSLAAPLLWATDGTVSSAQRHILEYVQRLEYIVAATGDELGDSCESHSEYQDSCYKCEMIALIKKIRR